MVEIILKTGATETVEVEPLTAIEREEIEQQLHHYPNKRAATIEALKIVQKHQRWVSDGKIIAIANILELSPEDIEGVATFYNQIYRQAVGDKVVKLCDSVSCWIMGYEGLRDYICQQLNVELGGTTEDKKFTVIPAPCLGACDKAPVAIVENKTYTEMTTQTIDKIISG